MGGMRSHVETVAGGIPPRGEYDLFLSHATPDKAWILTLAKRLEALGLRVFVDTLEIDPGDNWVIHLNDALRTLGFTYAKMGESEMAINLLQQAKVLAEEIGDSQIVQFFNDLSSQSNVPS